MINLEEIDVDNAAGVVAVDHEGTLVLKGLAKSQREVGC
jgi:hypothetical protein